MTVPHFLGSGLTCPLHEYEEYFIQRQELESLRYHLTSWTPGFYDQGLVVCSAAIPVTSQEAVSNTWKILSLILRWQIQVQANIDPSRWHQQVASLPPAITIFPSSMS